jgi:hypothetical protein
MEKPPRLKDESEKLVSADEQHNSANALQIVGNATNAQDSVGTDVPPSSGTDVPASSGPDAQPLVAAPVQIIRDSAAEREAKKLADQKFLAAYKKHELFLRTRFCTIVLLLVGVFAVSVPKFFDYIDSETRVINSIVPAAAAAFIGEKDAAYFKISEFPLPKQQDRASVLVDIRKKILDRSISDLERTGRTAIFSRLGAEQLLMDAGRRASGLKYGDYLISKYPNLPSNYGFRALVDFERGDFVHAISEFDQFFALIKDASREEAKSWENPIKRAIWSCIEYVRIDKAKEFLLTYKQSGAETWEIADLQASMLLAQYDQLDVANLQKTSFWNPALANFSSKLLYQARQTASALPSFFQESESKLIEIDTRAKDFKEADERLSVLERFDFSKLRYRYVVASAQVALARDKPKDVIQNLDKFAKQYNMSPELDLLLATALQRTHETQRAVEAADDGLAESPYYLGWMHVGGLRQPLLMIKARALMDDGKFVQALQICNQVLEASPDMIAPQLLKLQISQKQNKQPEITRLSAIISSQLKRLAP